MSNYRQGNIWETCLDKVIMFAIPFGAASGSEITVQLLRKKTLFSQKHQESKATIQSGYLKPFVRDMLCSYSPSYTMP